MIIDIDKNKLCSEKQSIRIENSVLTLIGENGCGKSSILEAIFEKYLGDDNFRTICFSSGQNELFTELFNTHKRKNKKYKLKEELFKEEGDIENNSITSFYFNYSWVRILIFFATILKSNGKVREYLISKRYIRINGSDDISSRLYFPFRVRKYYTERIQNEIWRESTPDFDFLTKLVKNSDFHKTIVNIISANNIPFEFEDDNYKTLVKRGLVLNSNSTFRIFEHKNIDKIFTFWALATHTNERNIAIEECRLFFDNELEFKQLSDGEYQLLAIYALIDLFDADNTLFLFDEIDSHLYFRNIENLWTLLKENINGNVITTTHIADSIIQNEFHSLRIVENGRVLNDSIANELKNRFKDFSNNHESYYKVVSKIPYLALVEDESDWIIFKELAKIKIGANYSNSKLEGIQIIKCSSGYSSQSERLGNSKIDWADNFLKVNLTFSTQAIFMICDRDEFTLNDFHPTNGVQIIGTHKYSKKFNNQRSSANLLSWKRKQIENYLLSYTMLANFGKLDEINDELGRAYHLLENEPMDIVQIQNLEIKTQIQSLYVNNGQILTPNNPEGINYERLFGVIREIPTTEISEDIEKMYNFIVSKIN